jgi:hypothetical protein
MRYAYPAELDLMARLAGIRLTARWAGWQGQPFTRPAASTYRCGSARTDERVADDLRDRPRGLTDFRLLAGAPGTSVDPCDQ